MSPLPGVAGGTGPEHLVVPEATDVVAGDSRFDDLAAEFDAKTGDGDPLAEFVVVCELSHQRFEAACCIKRGSSHGERGAKAKADAPSNTRAVRTPGIKSVEIPSASSRAQMVAPPLLAPVRPM